MRTGLSTSSFEDKPFDDSCCNICDRPLLLERVFKVHFDTQYRKGIHYIAIDDSDLCFMSCIECLSKPTLVIETEHALEKIIMEKKL